MNPYLQVALGVAAILTPIFSGFIMADIKDIRHRLLRLEDRAMQGGNHV